MSINSEEMLESLCAAGKELTIGITITNKELAAKLMSTMYGHDAEQFGFVVNSWGFFNSEEAYKIREKLITAEMVRHTNSMSNLNNPNLLKELLGRDEPKKHTKTDGGIGEYEFSDFDGSSLTDDGNVYLDIDTEYNLFYRQVTKQDTIVLAKHFKLTVEDLK